MNDDLPSTRNCCQYTDPIVKCLIPSAPNTSGNRELVEIYSNILKSSVKLGDA